MTHANAPLTPAGRLRLVQRCKTRPIAHVAAEAGISRQCLSKWKARYDEHGEAGLVDRASVPRTSPTQLDQRVVEQIEAWRREHKWTARQIHRELTRTGHQVSLATVGRWMVRLGINRRRDLDPDGQVNRTARRITARYPGHMVHIDVKKVGRIPDGGANYRATTFTRTVTAVASRHQCIRPHTPRHNGKVERYNRILAEELLYARLWTSEAERAAAIEVWNVHYNYHRAHTAAGDQPPAAGLRA